MRSWATILLLGNYIVIVCHEKCRYFPAKCAWLPHTMCFTAADSDKVMKHQQIQTEILETVDRHVQAGSTAQQQGVCIDTMY